MRMGLAFMAVTASLAAGCSGGNRADCDSLRPPPPEPILQIRVEPRGRQTLVRLEDADLLLGGHLRDDNRPGNAIVARFAPDGTERWAHWLGDAPLRILDFAGDDGDRACLAGFVVYLAGLYNQALDFGGGATMTAPSFGEHGWIAHLGSDGSHRWSHHVRGGRHGVRFNGLQATSEGHLVTGGYAAPDHDFGDGELERPSFTGGSSFVVSSFSVSYDPEGALRWGIGFGGMFQPRSIRITSDDRVVLAGPEHERELDPCGPWPPVALERGELVVDDGALR